MRLIESDLGSLLSSILLEESSVSIVGLLLNGGAELHQFFRHGLIGALEHVDERARKTLLMFSEESNGSAILSSTSSTTDLLAYSYVMFSRLRLTGRYGGRSPQRSEGK